MQRMVGRNLAQLPPIELRNPFFYTNNNFPILRRCCNKSTKPRIVRLWNFWGCGGLQTLPRQDFGPSGLYAPIRERTNVQTDPHHIVVWGVAKLLPPTTLRMCVAYKTA